jgi:hypothetical protein
MKFKIFIKIFLLIIFIAKPSLAQEISSSNSKNYETKTIKKDNEIEIRLIPKNPPPKVEKTAKENKNLNEDEDSSELESEDSAINNEATKDSEMVYEKSVEDDNSSNQEVNNIQTKNANSAREESLKLWREEQRKLREERIEARKEEARKKYQAQKERSVIKEIENLNQKLKQAKSSKNTMPNYYSGSTTPTTPQNQNSDTIPANTNATTASGSTVTTSPNSNSNSNASSTPSNNNINPSAPPANIPTQNSR